MFLSGPGLLTGATPNLDEKDRYYGHSRTRAPVIYRRWSVLHWGVCSQAPHLTFIELYAERCQSPSSASVALAGDYLEFSVLKWIYDLAKCRPCRRPPSCFHSDCVQGGLQRL